MRINNQWVGWGLGDNSSGDFTVRDAKRFMRAMYASYAGNLADTNEFDQQMYDAVVEMQKRLVASGKLQWDHFLLGILDLPTEYAMGFRDKPLPVGISVEGHSSNMYFGPVADTFTQLEAEKVCRHQPTGYDNAPIPFNNQSGVDALADNVNRYPNDDIYIGGFSQGMIVVYDYFAQHGIPPRLKGCLFYGNPCRKLGSAAQWCLDNGWVKNKNTHGLDPLRRFELPGCVSLDSTGIPYVDVWRQGDIFTDEDDSLRAQIAEAVYQAVARGDFMSNPYSIAANIAEMFSKPIEYVFAIVQEIIGALVFVANPNNPHYSPFDIVPGMNWMRDLMRANS